MNIIIFQKTGVTHKFEKVKDLLCSNGVVSFRYFGLSTQTERFAVFHDIGGYSIEDEDRPGHFANRIPIEYVMNYRIVKDGRDK